MSELEGTVQDNATSVNALSDAVDRKKWEMELRVSLRSEYEQLFKVWKQTDLVELARGQDKAIQEGLVALFNKHLEEQKPPTHEDIQQLLNQEYEVFPIKVLTTDDSGTEKEELFTIRELPQAAEKHFFKQFKDKILSRSQELMAFTQEGMDKPFEEKAKAFMDLFDDSFDMLADAVVIVLNPFGKRTDITRTWVQASIGSDRQWRIVEAQIQVNRIKDFFSRVSQSGLATQTMLTGQRFQQLQQLAR